jgi:hypothetical protein
MWRSLIYSSFYVLLGGAILAPFAAAQDWPAIDPAELAMKTFPQQPGAAAVVLIREENDNDPLHFHSSYERLKILTEDGRRYADIEIPYSRRNFRIDTLSGRTIHPDGSIVPFDGKPFDKTVQKGRGYRYNVKAFSLPDVQVGSIIEFRYSLRYDDHMVLPPDWEIQTNLFQKHVSFKFIPFQFNTVSQYIGIGHDRIADRVSWSSFVPKDSQPKLMSTPRSQWVELSMSDVEPLLEEPYSPPPRAMRMRANFYYTDGGSVEDYWKTESKYWKKEVESFVNHCNGASEALAKILGPSDTQEQKVKKIYGFVSQLENRSYIPERAIQEEHALNIKPNKNAEDVLQQRSGTHDELNLLFAALVQQAGLPASMMKVPDRTETFFDEHYLSTYQFDAEVVVVQVAGKEVFLDPGTKFCPYGLLNWRYAGNRGLRQADAKDAVFTEAPLSDYPDAVTQRVAKIKLTDDGRYEGTVNVGFSGLEAMERRRAAGHTDDEGRKKALEEEIKAWLPGGSDVRMTKKPRWDDTESMVAAEFSVSGPLATSAGKRWQLPPHIFEINETAKFPSSKRVNPVYLYYPYREIDEVHITLPAGMEPESLPPDETVKTEFAVYKTIQKMETPTTIFSRRDLVMGGMTFAVGRYTDVKGFYDKTKSGDDQTILLKAGTHVAGN